MSGGRKLSEEHKQKISETFKKKGIRPPDATGRKYSDEYKERLRLISRKTCSIGCSCGRHSFKSDEYKKKMSLALINSMKAPRGVNHWNWKGGVKAENISIRSSYEYKKWRKQVFERDNYMCIWCGKKRKFGERGSIQADHIKAFASFPELRFELANGRTLCIECHRKTDTYGRNL